MSPEERLEALRFNVARSLRYHDKRRAFFDLLGKALQMLALLGSSAAVLALVKESQSEFFAVLFSAVAAGSSLLNLVIGTTSKLEAYTKLKNRFLDLEGKIEAVRVADEETVQRLQDERYQIEKDEPAISNWLNKVVYNETVDALGYDQTHKHSVRWYHHLGNLKLT
jgi:hypothetical protein